MSEINSHMPRLPMTAPNPVQFNYPHDRADEGGTRGFLHDVTTWLRLVEALPPEQFAPQFPGTEHSRFARALRMRLADVALGRVDARVAFGQAEQKRSGRPKEAQTAKLAKDVIGRMKGPQAMKREAAMQAVSDCSGRSVDTIKSYLKRHAKEAKRLRAADFSEFFAEEKLAADVVRRIRQGALVGDAVRAVAEINKIPSADIEGAVNFYGDSVRSAIDREAGLATRRRQSRN